MGIGTSAGGLDALERFVQALPEETGLAFVIVQHLSVSHESHLAELLGRLTPLPIKTIDQQEELETDTIYLRQPSHELRVEGTTLLPIERVVVEPEAYFPIDRFLISLAEQRGERAIGMILSGMGTDGSRGVATIKEHGGLVLVQSPNTAQFTSMPSSAISYDIADLVASPEALATRLRDMIARESLLLSEAYSNSELHGTDLTDRLIEAIREKVGFDFSNYRSATINRRIDKRMLVQEVKSNREYLKLVQEDERECQVLAKSFLIGVTRFFRDPEAFAIIADRVIPQLFANSIPGRPIRVWVPSCSTGEEAYTLAILMEEYRNQHAPQQTFKVLASDVDPTSITVANRGYYPEHIKADVPPNYLETYFTPELNGFSILPQIQEQILFAVQDILSDPPFIRVDLITCRNFLIYVNVEAQARVLANFHFALNSNGYLMLGPSESLGKLYSAFASLDRRWKIYTRRLNDKAPTIAITPLHSGGSIPNKLKAEPYSSFLPPQTMNNGSSNLVRDPFAQFLADRYAPSTLFVSKNYDIRYINGEVDGLLKFPRHHTSFNLTKLTGTEISAILTSAVDTVLQEESSDLSGMPISVSDLNFGGQPYAVTVQRVELAEQTEPLASIILRPRDGEDESGETGERINSDQLIKRRIQTLEAQLLQSNVKAQRLLSELEATNEELQTSNRELLASNEEMQSTNEELQSVNEELHTVNNEIQQKNEQLNYLNNDINHLLESTDIGTIFLDGKLRIRRFTPSIRKQFSLHPNDVGRPLSDFSDPFVALNLTKKCQEVLTSKQTYEKELVDARGRDFLLRILPYHDLKDQSGGLVVTFIDISDLIETRKRLEGLASKYSALVKHSLDCIGVITSSGRILELNRWVEPGISPDELIGTYLTDQLVDDRQKVVLSDALRNVYDERVASFIQLMLEGEDEQITYLEVSLIPAFEPSKGLPLRRDMVVMIVRDITTQVLHQEQTELSIIEYQNRLAALEVQGGLMSLDGNFVHWNRSSLPTVSTEGVIKQNVRDLLTQKGLDKFEPALRRLRNGSFLEKIDYVEEDLSVPFPIDTDVIHVEYRPLIIGGKIQLITLMSRED